MDFSPNPDHALIVEAVDAVCATYDDTYWAQRDERHEFPWDFYADMAAGGWVGIAIPEAYGGGGQGIAEAASETGLSVATDWGRSRIAMAGDSRCLIGHHDMLALPPGTA